MADHGQLRISEYLGTDASVDEVIRRLDPSGVAVIALKGDRMRPALAESHALAGRHREQAP